MSKLSFSDKLNVFFEVSKSSNLFLIIFIILIILGIILMTTNKKNDSRNKIIYLSTCIFIVVFLFVAFHSSITKIFDYMMNNFFIALYFPTIAIYAGALIVTNIILWISLFNYKTSNIIKRLNVVVYLVMNYLFALILSVINTKKLDVFDQTSLYGNSSLTALIELSSLIFVMWIIFLILYKAILIYLKREYIPPVKKVVRKVKKLPSDYLPIEVPEVVYGEINKPRVMEENITKNVYDQLFTLEDYKVLLQLLKEKQMKNKKTIVKEELTDDQYRMRELRDLYRSVK